MKCACGVAEIGLSLRPGFIGHQVITSNLFFLSSFFRNARARGLHFLSVE
jgi:hypothetical protein